MSLHRMSQVLDKTLSQRVAALVLETLVSGALGYCLLAAVGCSFDARPNNAGVHTNAATDARWMPPSAVDGGPKRSASAPGELDGSSDAMTAEAMSVASKTVDAGASHSSAAGSGGARASGAGQGSRAIDAGVNARDKSDAARPNTPNTRDAQPAPEKPDAAAKPDAGAQAGSARCQPGVYTGTFSGSINLIGVSFSSVTGTVRAQLTLSDSGQHLDMNDGHVMGVDQDGNRLTVDLTGRVNCASDQLEDGKLTNGNLHNTSGNSDTAFVGSAEAMYSRDPYSLVGTFSVDATEASGLLGGRGTWSLIRSN